MKIQSALFVELPRCVQFKHTLRARRAQSLARNEAWLPFSPGVGHRKKQRATPPHKNKFLVIGNCRASRFSRRRRHWLRSSVSPVCLASFCICGFRLRSLRRRTFICGYRSTRHGKSAVKNGKEKGFLKPEPPHA